MFNRLGSIKLDSARGFRRIPECVWREEEEETMLLFNFRSGEIIWLNKSATIIWRLCDGSHSINAIIDVLQKEYPEVERECLENDVITFIESLRNGKLINSV